MSMWRLFWFLGVVLTIGVGCDDTPPPADADADADADGDGDGGGDSDVTDGDQEDSGPETCPEIEPWERGNDGAADLTLPPTSGGAVAGRITSEGQLLDGLKPMGRVGDFLLGNGRIAVVIEDARPSNGYGAASGEVVDGDLIGPDGPLGISRFVEMFHGILPQVFGASEVSVLANGSDGSPAIVRVIGNLEALWLIDACCGDIFFNDLTLPIMIDYVLAPDSDALDVRLTIRNDTVSRETCAPLLSVMLGGDGLVRYAPEVGFDEEANFGHQDFVGLVGEQISYAWIAQEGLQYLISMSGVHIYMSGTSFLLPACEETSFDIGRFVISGGDASALESAIRRVQGEASLPSITGSVTDINGAPLENIRVHATDPDGAYLSMGRTDIEGRYRIDLSPGEVHLQAWADTLRPSEVLIVDHTDDGTTANLTMSASGAIAWTVRDTSGEEIPAKVSVVPLDEPAPIAPPTFGEPTHPNDAMIHDFSLPGRRSFLLSTGSYRLVASRGYEYEIDEVDVEITAGVTTEVELVLDRSVDTEGWLCGDFHIHTMYSPDSSDIVEHKVRSAAAVGLELPVSTDHRYVSDLQPVAESLGLTPWLRWFSGHEITTVVYGHFNAYPLPVLPDSPNQGAIEWVGLDPGELFDSVRSVSTDPVLQINHPRGSSPTSAYFDFVGLDPSTMEMVENPDGWSTNFDAFEVFNDSDWLSNRESTIRDWFGFLNHGHLFTAMGNSDSHNSEWNDVGYPRTCLRLDIDAPGDVDEDTLRDTIRAGRAVVSGGAFITAETIDGVGPGGVVAAPGGTATVHVVIQAPTWVDVDAAELIVNGETIETVTLDASTEDPTNPVIRFERDVIVELDDDGWFVVGAHSMGLLAPVTPQRAAFGATNAIYFDVDGDGEYGETGRAVGD